MTIQKIGLIFIFFSRSSQNVRNFENEVLLLTESLEDRLEAFPIWQGVITIKLAAEDKVDAEACLTLLVKIHEAAFRLSLLGTSKGRTDKDASLRVPAPCTLHMHVCACARTHTHIILFPGKGFPSGILYSFFSWGKEGPGPQVNLLK